MNERLVSVALLIPALDPGLGAPGWVGEPLGVNTPRVNDVCAAGGRRVGREDVAGGVPRNVVAGGALPPGQPGPFP